MLLLVPASTVILEVADIASKSPTITIAPIAAFAAVGNNTPDAPVPVVNS